MKNKFIATIADALRQCGLADGMTLSFHHHLRNGDHVVNMTLDVVASLGIKNITVACSSLFPVHEHLVQHIKSGVITGIDTDYMSGPLARAITEGQLLTPVMFRSHGGRPRAIGEGSLKIDIAVIAAPAVDALGNVTGSEGPSACGSLGYAMPDAKHAKHVIAVTDHLVQGGLGRVTIPHDQVDHVVVVDKIGDPAGIVSGSISLTRDPVALAIARSAQAVIRASGLLKDGFNYQTGAGGASLAASIFLQEDMRAMKLHGGFLLGGITKYMVEMLEEGLFDNVYDVQCFDLSSVQSIARNPRHVEISADTYANPASKSACVDYLDAALLGATEVDLNFNVNVTTDSNGNIIGGSGGHNDAAAGAKLTIIVAPLVRARLPIVVDKCTTLTTKGETVDVLVTERGIAVNPARKELADRLRDARLPVCDIAELHEAAMKMTGKPLPFEHGDKVVGTVEYRDGTIVDKIYATK